MAVVIEREEWEIPSSAYYLLFLSCFASLFSFPFFSTRSSPFSLHSFDHAQALSFLRFQRGLLLVYSLASVTGSLQMIYGEVEFMRFGLSRDQIALIFSVVPAVSLFVGSFAGIFSDIKGPRKACLLYCMLHLFAGMLKCVNWLPFVWIASAFVAIASSLFSFCFETWMVTEHEKQGHRKDLLTDTFWRMTFFESISLLGSQVLANLLTTDAEGGTPLPFALAAILAILGFLYIKRKWSRSQDALAIWSYQKSFSSHVLRDKKIWALGWAQASIHFSTSIFWLLWAPSILADGRDVQLSRLYPLFIGSRVLGSTVFPWFYDTSSPYYSQNSLTSAFAIAGLALSMIAYDYQEIGALLMLFCIFHACVGFILPSLATLRTMYMPNEVRGGMISMSMGPANAAILLVMLAGAYHKAIVNSAIMAVSAFALLTSCGCVHMLKRSKKHQSWHDL
ncbi:Major facilitator superfamily protein [Rhynchospora pubera]|uniref:Major facilitator superfamily protein n=1 Tax=Rhynchospora pubera TaxID=906938 RepID=A0AAV8ERQ1_9POAL|nr:Major facilitator superfamily protein [Rhynchospora pubera]